VQGDAQGSDVEYWKVLDSSYVTASYSYMGMLMRSTEEPADWIYTHRKLYELMKIMRS
jgi:hypothetical protein